MILHLILLNIIFFIDFGTCRLACKDEYNNDVDWFIALKYPKSYRFVYLNNNSFSQWNASTFSLHNSKNFIGLTTGQTSSSNKTNSFHAFYNDEVPCENPDNYEGHLKGVLSFNINEGFWMIHSVPKFPTFGDYHYGIGQTVYGQSFICLSLKTADLKSIIGQMLIMKSQVYSFNIPTNFTNDIVLLNLLKKFVLNQHIKSNHPFDVFQPNTAYNFHAFHFAKSPDFHEDLYDSLVAPYFRSDIWVESWMREGRMNSTCNTKYKVYNVKEVSLVDNIFTETRDHSKWVVSKNESNTFVCIGDMNRMHSQFKKGGGTICIINKPIWKIFNALVHKYEKCNNMQSVIGDCPEYDVL